MPDDSAALAETHSAVVVLLGDRAYKVKKPVDLGFLDFSTREARAEACRLEVELNRRLAPDVYLGVADIRDPDGEVCDHMVVMRRLPTSRKLSRCLANGENVADALRAVARSVSTLHARPARGPSLAYVAERDAVRRRWTDGFAQMATLRDGIVEPGTQAEIERLALRFLDGRDELFARRIERGHVRNGHGDLQAEDIFLLDDGPRIIDCLDFDAEMRWGDVLNDVAFLAMDLERLGHPEAARTFLAAYREFSAENWSPPLAHHYIAYRAHVRAKVAALRAEQTGEPTPEIEALQHLCLSHLRRSRIRLVLVGGLPGTGKSTVATGLGDRGEAVVLRSDQIRRELPAGTTERPEDRYSAESVSAVYDRMLARAERLLRAGEHVVLDATWSDAAHREQARAVAERCCADLVELRCEAPADLCRARIERRLATGNDPSEATPGVHAWMSDRFDPWPESAPLATSDAVDLTIDTAASAADWTS